MGINIASLFATIGVNTDPLNKGLGSAKQSLQGFGGEMAKQVVGTVSLAAAVYKAGQVVVDSVRDWADYADGMRLSAQMAGVTTEEMSRLAQAADDFRVPIETVQRSMEMALKNGFTPTIDNLAALSDHLLAINDPALTASPLIQVFLGAEEKYRVYALSKRQLTTGPVDGELSITLSEAGSVAVTVLLEEV